MGAGDKPANPCEQGSDGDEEEGGEENDGEHEGGEIDHCAELAAVVDDEGNWNLADLRELAEELDDNFNGEEFDQCVTEDFIGAYITWCGDKANTKPEYPCEDKEGHDGGEGSEEGNDGGNPGD